MKAAAEEPQQALVAVRDNTAPGEITGMIHLAIEKGVPVETLERLVALHERVTDRQARMEFNADLGEFQGECPPIAKTSTAEIMTRSGGKYSYNFADLAQIARVVNPLLQKRGFSYSWDSKLDGKMLTVTCKLKHVNGHVEPASFSTPVDSASAMSEQQKHAAALSYARRMSLVQVLGITTADPDTDGAEFEPITPSQVDELKRLAKEVSADEKKFLGYLGFAKYEDIPRSRFATAKRALESKRKPV